jgi:hypothetical protein
MAATALTTHGVTKSEAERYEVTATNVQTDSEKVSPAVPWT